MDFGYTQPAILAMGTGLPPYRIDQPAFGAIVAEALDASPALRRWLKRLYELSSIDTRYSCLPEAESLTLESRFSPGLSVDDSATTSERMAIYQRESVAIGTAAAERALADLDTPDAADSITHLIVVSCTGFFAPGLDLAIARKVGLRSTVQRTLVGFMGCAAAFNALRLASQIVTGQPDARVLVVCVELCTLHIQGGADRINVTVASLFADGAAACVVGAADERRAHMVLDRFYTDVYPDSEDSMAWRVGNHGFEMNLSPDVPRHVAAIAGPALAALRGDLPAPSFWAIHPGGRAIVDRFAEALNLSAEETAPSYDVLRRYGNMSSPTILFVLNDIFDKLRSDTNQEQANGVATAFGPGLVVEMAYLTYQPAFAFATNEQSSRAEYVA